MLEGVKNNFAEMWLLENKRTESHNTYICNIVLFGKISHNPKSLLTTY